MKTDDTERVAFTFGYCVAVPLCPISHLWAHISPQGALLPARPAPGTQQKVLRQPGWDCSPHLGPSQLQSDISFQNHKKFTKNLRIFLKMVYSRVSEKTDNLHNKIPKMYDFSETSIEIFFLNYKVFLFIFCDSFRIFRLLFFFVS